MSYSAPSAVGAAIPSGSPAADDRRSRSAGGIDDGRGSLRTQLTTALGRSALLKVVEALKAADDDDRIRSAATTIDQASIEAELTAVIVRRRTSAPRPAPPSATAPARGVSRPLPGIRSFPW